MKIYREVEAFQKLDHAIVTSGIFDGVHKGHQKILSRLVETAHDEHGQSVVITFWPHPRKILQSPSSDIKILTTLEEKITLIEKSMIDHLLIIPFTQQFAQISSNQFVHNILIESIGTKKLVIGYDHKFGKNREGSFEYLRNNSAQFGFAIEEIPRQDIEDIGVSSTLIRKALSEGNVKKASTFLGRCYSLSGTVVKGKQLGKTIGYPTANIQVDHLDKLIPQDGIYAVKVVHNASLYNGMLSIGFNPTVNGTIRTIEVNIFDFDQSIYGEKLEILFIDFLRSEKKFDNLEQLKDQLFKDKIQSLKILS